MANYDAVPWRTFHSHFTRNWRQGQHLSIVGPTNCGKTTLLTRILPIRTYVVVFITKVHDDTITSGFKGYDVIPRWPPPRPATQDRILLWPVSSRKKRGQGKRPSIRGAYVTQRTIFREAMDSIFMERNWCVVFDEQHYLCRDLSLDKENTMLLQQGRSSGLSIVNCTQRPAWVPLATYSQASHAMLWRTTHRDDLRRLAELGGADNKELEHNLLRLGEHEFIYVDVRNARCIRTQVEL